MIVLNINVVSEPLRSEPDAAVLAWLDAQASETLYLTSITVAELMAGVAVLPAGKRRNQLAQAMSQKVLPLFETRVLPFDLQAAHTFGDVRVAASASGNPISFADCAIAAIAAIAAVHGFAVATRNVRDFRGTGIPVIDPWKAAA